MRKVIISVVLAISALVVSIAPAFASIIGPTP
jgi:hypothetical protein